MLSSLHVVRSWMSAGFTGHSQQTTAGFVNHCRTTDMQISRLQDPVRALPWDQLVKRGVEEVYDRCLVVLDSAGGLPARPIVDEYRSVVCEQLRSMEPVSPGTRRSPVKPKRASFPGPRAQVDVVLETGTNTATCSSRSSAGRKTVRTPVSRGQRTEGKPGKKKNTLAVVVTDDGSQADKRTFEIGGYEASEFLR